MNKKGFTLIELLAVLIILGVIMVIAVPSTINVLDRSKKQQYIVDAKKMITLAEGYMRSHEDIEYPTGNQIVVLYLSRINDGTLDTDAEGYTYDGNTSFVTVTYKSNGLNYTYDFYTQLVGRGDSKNRGVILSNLEALNSDNKFNLIEKNMETNISCSTISTKVLGTNSGVCVEYK